MKKFIKLLILTASLSIFSCFVALSAEGTFSTKHTENEEVLSYAYDNGVLATNEWKYVREKWYYFGEDGRSKQNTWAEIDGKWYYFDQWSVMLHGTTTPDGYYVGSDGAWVKTENGKDIILDISVTQ